MFQGVGLVVLVLELVSFLAELIRFEIRGFLVDLS